MLERLRLALLDRSFRSVLVVVAIVPITISYAYQTLVIPIVSPSRPIDFFDVYIRGAAVLLSGGDPYQPCLANGCWSYLENAWWFYPPVVQWLAQPLVHVNQSWSGPIALVAAQLCVAIFLLLIVRSLRIRDWQVIATLAVVVMAFPPLTSEVEERNLQVLLLALSAVWFAGWLDGDRWWAGVALGTGIALKLVQSPLLLLTIWFRRPWTAVAAMLSLAVLWLVGAPQYLGEYLFRIVPVMNLGGAGPMNVSAVAAVARLVHPASLYETGYGTGIDAGIRVIGYAIAAAVLVLSGVALRSPRVDREGRALEAALAVAATPLLVSLVRPGQLLLSLLPMLVLGTIALRRGDWRLGVAVAISWALIGPTYLWMSNALAAGLAWPMLRLGAETAFIGTIVLWLASVQALRYHGATAPYVALEASKPRIGSIYT